MQPVPRILSLRSFSKVLSGPLIWVQEVRRIKILTSELDSDGDGMNRLKRVK